MTSSPKLQRSKLKQPCYQEAVACRDALATAEKTAAVAKLEEAKASLEFQAILL